MWSNWKRYTLGALLLASLSLVLFGCGDNSSSTQTAQNGSVAKPISGVVSGDNGLPVANATVTAYAIDANGVQKTTPLSANPTSTTTNADGVYLLYIPAGYAGPVMLEATIPPAKLLDRLAKVLFAGTDRKMRSALPARIFDQASVPPVMISFATNAVVEFIQQNTIVSTTPAAGFSQTGFSSDNIQKATFVMEAFFGAYFSQIPPPKSEDEVANSSKAQQDLMVFTRALVQAGNAASAPVSLTQFVTSLATTGLGDAAAEQITRAVTAVTSALAAANTLPAEYQPAAAINSAISNATNAAVTLPLLTDATAPGAAQNLNAIAVDAKTVGLSWTPALDGGPAATGVAGYLIYRADTVTPYLAIDTVGKDAASYNDATAAPATQYNYKVVAFDAARNLSAASNVAAVKTPAVANPADTSAPGTPAGLICQGFNAAQVNLQWVQSTDISSDGSLVPAAGYQVYRDDRVVAVVTESSYIDSNVAAGTEYSYYVKAYDANSNLSAASAPLTVRTAHAAGVTPPAAPTGLALEAALYNKAVLVWTASASAAVSYKVYRGAQEIAEGITSTRYSDSSVTPDSTYVYTVTAVNANGESAAGNALTVLVPANSTNVDTAPSVPGNLMLVVPATPNSVPLMWSASTKSDGDRIVAGYEILRAAGTSSNYVMIATVTRPGYTDSSVAASTSYSYQIRAFSSNGTRSAASSPALSVTTGAVVNVGDTTPPSTPANLTASATANAVALTWTASVKSTGDGIVAGYRVYRDGVQIAGVTPQSAGAATISYIDNSVRANSSYRYTVRAFDNPGNLSGASNEISVTTPTQVANSNTISGRVTINGIGLAGITLNITGDGTGSFITDANGFYSGPVLYGAYTITPSAPGYLFTPTSKSVAVSSLNRPVQDFSAVFTGSITGGGSFPNGSTGVVMTYPNGTVVGGVTFPPGTIIGGVSYPSGAVIGGVTYPTATVIGGVTYPTGTVIGGVLYPNGVIIGGVSYPAGTIVGGVAFPVGAITTGITIPSGTVIGGVTYPTGALVGGVSYPAGSIIGGVTYPNGSVIGSVSYPTGTVIGGVTFPVGIVAGAVSFPSGSVTGAVTYPIGSLIGGVTYPSGTIIGGVSYPNGSLTVTVIGGISYPTGTVLGGVSYPNGVIIGGVNFPAGTIVGGVAFPVGAATAGFSFPTGSVIGAGNFPTGTIIGGLTYPTGIVSGGVVFGGGSISLIEGTLLFP
jgi:fibronectin type 3 domain-containing protein